MFWNSFVCVLPEVILHITSDLTNTFGKHQANPITDCTQFANPFILVHNKYSVKAG